MLRSAKKLDAKSAANLHIIDELADDYRDLVQRAVRKVDSMLGNLPGIPDAPVEAPLFDASTPESSEGDLLSATVIAIIEATVAKAAAAPSLGAALEIGYRAFGDSACTAAAREGIESFQQRRKPDFGKTG